MEFFMNYLRALPPAVAQGMIWGIMAIGVYITYKILDIADLTVDGSICTGAAVCAVLMAKGCNVWVALFGALLAGMLAGLITGVIHTFMGIPPILAGILTQLILWSVNLKVLGLGFDPIRASASNLALPARKYDLLVSQLDINHTIIVLELICIAVIGLLYWFFGTEYGCSVRATGANLAMSRAQGINTNNRKIFGLVLSNGLVALSGGLLAQYQGNADANMGKGAIVIGLAAICIGDALFSWLCRNNFALKLIAVVLGSIVYYIVYVTVIYLGLDSTYLKMLSALLVAVFLAVPYWKGKFFTSKKHLKEEVSSEGEGASAFKTKETTKNKAKGK